MASAGSNEILLSDPPTDGISSVCFAPASDLLLASSWDSVSRALSLCGKSDGGCAGGGRQAGGALRFGSEQELLAGL